MSNPVTRTTTTPTSTAATTTTVTAANAAGGTGGASGVPPTCTGAVQRPVPATTAPPITTPAGSQAQYLAWMQANMQAQANLQAQAAQGVPGAAVPMLFPNLTVTDSKIGIKIPTFYGDGTDGGKTTAYKFREMLERAMTLNKWSDKDTAEVAITNLSGDAAEWADRMVRSNRPEERAIMNTWTQMRGAFMKRFDVMPTPTQKIAKISNISMYPKETAKRYYDRLREALDYIGKETLLNPPPHGTWEQGFLAASDVIFETFYLRGLDPKIRLQVQAQLGKDCSLEDLVEKANEVDELLKEEKQNTVKSIQMASMQEEEPKPSKKEGAETDPVSKMQKEIQLLSGQLAAMSAGRGTGGKAAGKPTPTKKSQNIAHVPMKDRGWILCYTCRQFGQHFAHECRLSKDEIKLLDKKTQKDKPSGKAHDAQFGTRQEN